MGHKIVNSCLVKLLTLQTTAFCNIVTKRDQELIVKVNATSTNQKFSNVPNNNGWIGISRFRERTTDRRWTLTTTTKRTQTDEHRQTGQTAGQQMHNTRYELTIRPEPKLNDNNPVNLALPHHQPTQPELDDDGKEVSDHIPNDNDLELGQRLLRPLLVGCHTEAQQLTLSIEFGKQWSTGFVHLCSPDIAHLISMWALPIAIMQNGSSILTPISSIRVSRVFL